jgi:hypothetical protein
MSANEDSSSDDDDFNFESSNVVSKRYPVHDCCEYEDVESLRVSCNVTYFLTMNPNPVDPSTWKSISLFAHFFSVMERD